jgi:hypothetical protein
MLLLTGGDLVSRSVLQLGYLFSSFVVKPFIQIRCINEILHQAHNYSKDN